MHALRLSAIATLVALGLAGPSSSSRPLHAQERQDDPQAFRFRSAVELINVTATVTDANGRFVSGLRKEDFRVYEDEKAQTITHFDSERVPVSLGIVLDTSGSMDGVKMAAARRALNRFLYDLLGRDDEVFLYRFDSNPELIEGWTTDRRRISDALAGLVPRGGTALYDAVAAAIPLARTGRHRKKALVVISDGNDTSSHVDIAELKAMIRESEVLVYAIGIDAQADTTPWTGRRDNTPALSSGLSAIAAALTAGVNRASWDQRPRPVPRPFPVPGGRPGRPAPRPPSPLPPRGPILKPPAPPYPVPPARTNPSRNLSSERVNISALRDITDDSGGRTEIVRTAHDLDPATAGIADELSKQYYLGYPATGVKDGRWHSIRVEVTRAHYRVRARRGFVASP
jgi:VWFA-related protein